MPRNHDRSYRLLFSHRRLAEDLLRGFLPAERSLGLSPAMEKASEIRVADRLARREQDTVWCLRRDDGPDVYLLLEFQSQPDRHMSLRMRTYAGLLCEDLIRQGKAPHPVELPPVLPVVIYNGRAPWAPSGAGEPGFLLVDVLRGPLPQDPENLVARLFGLERSRSPEEIDQRVAELAKRLDGPESLELRRSFAVFLRESLLPGRFPGAEIPALPDLEEVRPMLRETVIEWTRQWEAAGVAKGLEKGRREGEADLLVRLLECRFGTLQPWYRDRIAAAGTDRLLDWGERLLSAGSLSEVFED